MKQKTYPDWVYRWQKEYILCRDKCLMRIFKRVFGPSKPLIDKGEQK